MVGKLLSNRYELLEKIGEGGMGIVYKAKCHLLNRFVAIKILKAELSDDEGFVARFKKEADSAARLSHPNIVNVHDVGAENNINFIIMEYINGKTLKQVITENGRLSYDKSLEIAIQIAKALECAHKNYIIHRDIKPDNILITEDNLVKVTDFGIAKMVDSQSITNDSMVIGSVHYFSPEQAKGSLIDLRTDIYSLGIVMYEMIIGRVPYESKNSVSVAMMHIKESVIPPIEFIKDIPVNINQAILKALEKEPINRYQTAKEMVEHLIEIKKEPDFKLSINNNSSAASELMETIVISEERNDFTTIMRQPLSPEKSIIKKDKKIRIIIASIILVIIIGGLVKYISKGPSTDTVPPLVKTEVPKTKEKLQVDEKLPVDEKKLVPSLIGSTQDIAEQTIVDNGFLLGNILNSYSNNIAKGVVISQSPEVDTSYEKNGKIDLVISKGQKIAQVTVPQLKGETVEEARRILNSLQLKLGVATPVTLNGKGSKGSRSKENNGKIFRQETNAGTLVNIGTEINVFYYKTK
ncbi:MAG: Stk1 family PASTA domain-containing Ser/Thr kinase [Clostridiaceae bacterium]|nr:Stk1 family PASTA domain-containing Ser/Thr kinase [Clostridiaceae bacterium]